MAGSDSVGKQTAPPLVLIVQGDAGRRSAYAEALEGWGFRVAQAESAQSGLRSAWDLTPDVIAVDVAGLGSEGGQFLRGLWGVPATSRIPLVRFCDAPAGPGAGDDNAEHSVVLAPGSLPEQLLAAIVLLLNGPGASGDGLNRNVRVPDITPPFTRPKRDRRRDVSA